MSTKNILSFPKNSINSEVTKKTKKAYETDNIKPLRINTQPSKKVSMEHRDTSKRKLRDLKIKMK